MTRSRSSGRVAASAVALLSTAALLGACSGGEGEEAEAARGAALAPAAALERDPSAISCGHVRDQMRWAKATRQATVALADRELPRLNRLRATQSVFYAMTELCKGKPDSHRPAKDAVAGVRSGVYRVGG